MGVAMSKTTWISTEIILQFAIINLQFAIVYRRSRAGGRGWTERSEGSPGSLRIVAYAAQTCEVGE